MSEYQVNADLNEKLADINIGVKLEWFCNIAWYATLMTQNGIVWPCKEITMTVI